MSFARHKQTVPVQEQWSRCVRWYRRLIAEIRSKERDPDLIMDTFFALCQNIDYCYDWLLNSGSAKSEVEALYSSDVLRLCRDICNGQKHLTISRPKSDPEYMTVREYDYSSQPEHADRTNFVVLAGGHQRSIEEFSGACLTQLQNYLRGRGYFDRQSEVI